MEKLFKSMKEGEEWFYKCFGKDETFDADGKDYPFMGYAYFTPLY